MGLFFRSSKDDIDKKIASKKEQIEDLKSKIDSAKKNIFVVLLFAFFASILFQTNAQVPYKNSIGATLGTTQAFSYKTFFGDHFAIQVDLGTKYCYVYGSHLWSAEAAPNFMYEGRLAKGLYGFLGLGGSIGYNWQPFYYIVGLEPGDAGYNPNPDPADPTPNSVTRRSVHNCKAGANGMFGLEYKFDIPLTLQLDFRPGYRCVFAANKFADHKFDWGLNFGVRYTF